MDPLESVIVGHDTTFALMLEAERRGHDALSFEQKDLFFRDGASRARMRRVSLRRQPGDHFEVLEEVTMSLDELDALFLRKDPPVDVEFLHATQLAELARGPFVINSPSGLRDANEKLFALLFPELIPPTMVSRDVVALRAFLDELGGEMVIKPVDGFGGRGVLHLRKTDPNLSALLEIATRHGSEAIVAQAYLPEGRTGDKRVILLDGEPIGALLRVPAASDTRSNLAVGGRAEKTDLDGRDREICDRVTPELRRRGLWFVGLDIIGRFLTEVNVTSPTGIEEINRLSDVRLEAQILDFVEGRTGSGGRR